MLVSGKRAGQVGIGGLDLRPGVRRARCATTGAVGGISVNAARRVERRVRQSQVLLERMSRERERVLEVLGPVERGEMMEELHMLAEQAATVRRGSELLALTNDVIRLVEKRPALKEEFAVKARRTGNWGDLNNLLSDIQALEYANQIANSVERLGQAVDQELQKLSKQGNNGDHR